jgi:hypothetical protein
MPAEQPAGAINRARSTVRVISVPITAGKSLDSANLTAMGWRSGTMPFQEASMGRFRITLAVAMAAVVYLGFAFAAVLRPTALWAEAWSTGNLVVLAVAVLGAIYSKGCTKVFWGGFAIVCGGFLALNIFPAEPLHLVTRGLAERYYGTLSHDPAASEEFVWVSRGRDRGHEKWRLEPSFPGDRKGTYRLRSDAQTGSVVTGMFPAATLKPLGPDEYLLLCHLTLAPVLGLAGGVVARAFAGWPHGHEATGSGEASSD